MGQGQASPMTTLNSFYAQAAALTNLDQRRWALGAAYRLGEYVSFGYSIAAARTLVSAVPQYANGMVAAGLDDDYALIDDVGAGPPPAPGVFVNDTFTDVPTTGLALHTGEVGAVWTEHPTVLAGAHVITDLNRVRCQTGASMYYASGTPTTAEYDVEAPFFVASVVGAPGLMARLDTTLNTGYHARFNATGWELVKFVNNVTTSLGTSAFTPVVGQTYVVKLQIRDATKKVFVDGAEVISSVDNAITAAGVVGVRSNQGVLDTTGFHYDRFTATNV